MFKNIIKFVTSVVSDKNESMEDYTESQSKMCSKLENGKRKLDLFACNKSDAYVKEHVEHLVGGNRAKIEGYEYVRHPKLRVHSISTESTSESINASTWIRLTKCNCKALCDVKVVAGMQANIFHCINEYLDERKIDFKVEMDKTQERANYTAYTEFGEIDINVRCVSRIALKKACVSCGCCLGWNLDNVYVNNIYISNPENISKKDIGKYLIENKIELAEKDFNERKMAADICAE